MVHSDKDKSHFANMQEKKSQNATVVLNRLKHAYNIKTDSDLAALLGVARNTISTWRTRDSVDYSSIFAKCEQINLNWLITGEGEIFKTKTPKNFTNENGEVKGEKMGEKRKLQNHSPFDNEEFKTKTPKNVLNQNEDNFEDKKEDKRKLQKTSSIPPVLYDMPEKVSLVTERGATPYIKGKTFVEVPVVDIDAAAGGGAVNSDYTDEFDKLRIPTTILPATASTRRCINVAGESMEPTLFDGARIIVRLLHRTEWATIRSGSVYVVTNRDGETFIKRVRNKLRAHGVLVLTSDNPDQRRFKPFELTEEEIFNVWAVELVITDVLLPSQREETDDLRDQISELREMFERFIQREN